MKNQIKKFVTDNMSYIILGIVSILLLIRCFYSFTWSDESFYLTLAHRFWLGESMIADEWFTAQISTPILLPFYYLYQFVMGGNEGVYLYYRIIYWLLSVFTAFFIFYKLKKYHRKDASLITSLMYLLYSRANIGGMSYYNMTLTFVVLATLLIYGQVMEGKAKFKTNYIVGILLALAVVATPYLALPYIIIAAGFMLLPKCRKYIKTILQIILGTGTIALIYLAFLLSRTSIQELLLNIPYILNEPELQKTSPVLVLPIMIARIAWRYKWTIVFFGVLVISVLYLKWKKKIDKIVVDRVLIINLIIFIVNWFLSWGLIGCINIAVVLFSIVYLLCIEEVNHVDANVIKVFGIAGCSVSLAFSFSSDTGLDAMTIGFVVLGIGAVLVLYNQLQYKKYIYVVVMIMLVQTAILRLFSVYRDAPIYQLDTMITSGPAKYLYTTAEHVEQYEELKETIEKYVREEDRVFYSQVCFWSYLCTENHYGVPSSWRMAFNSPRIEQYFKLYPEKTPTCIFVLKPEYGNFESSLIQGNEKTENPNSNVIEGFLAEYIEENNYEVIETSCAIIYRKRVVRF